MGFRRKPRSSSTTMTLGSHFNLSMKTLKDQSQTSSCACMINTSWFPAAAWLEDCQCVSPKHLMNFLRNRKNLFREVDHNIYFMGCAGTKTENPNKNADKAYSAPGPSNLPNSEQKANAAKPLPPTRLTQEQYV